MKLFKFENLAFDPDEIAGLMHYPQSGLMNFRLTIFIRGGGELKLEGERAIKLQEYLFRTLPNLIADYPKKTNSQADVRAK